MVCVRENRTLSSSAAESELTAERVVVGGDALAREADGRVVFVPGALPGERVRVRSLPDRRGAARAELIEVLDASAERVEAPCPHVLRGCGGCGWQHVALDAQTELRRAIVADALARIAHLPDVIISTSVVLPAEGYRTMPHQISEALFLVTADGLAPFEP